MIKRWGLSHLLLSVTLMGGVPSGLAAGSSPDNNQAIERLVEGQRQLDRLAWSHRIWPDSNLEQKPAFDTAVSVAATREQVFETRRLVAALRSYWREPISNAELQRELTRMTRSSKDPGRLVERFEALNHDPQLIYALIVEPVLAARRARLAFERDPRSFAQQKAQLMQQLRRSTDRFSGTRWMKVTRDRVDDEPWRESKTAMPAPLTAILDQWPEPLDLKETTESFYVRLSAKRSETRQTDWEAVWPKQRFDHWWAQHSNEFEIEARFAEESLALPAIDGSSGCAPGTWEYIASNPPDPRFAMFTVWTGTELLVWGGGNELNLFSGGGRYDPATDTWSQISSGTGAPSGRVQGTAVWTGSEMIVWGGRFTFSITSGYNTGGRYDPLLDRWTPTTTINAPTQRYRHAAVWTGSEMIVWGGRSQETGAVQTGARYNPLTDTWTPTAIDANTPTARTRPAVTWAGTAMFVWGGVAGGVNAQNGALYDPALDSWQMISTVDAPAGRDGGLAVWSGSEVILWGGASGLARNDGGRYRVSTQSWAPVSTVGAPTGRWFHAMVWTGSTMMTWGGWDGAATIQYGDGGSYDPISDSWTPIVGDASVIGPSAEAAIAWSGSELLVWGGRGEGIGSTIGGRGGRYNPNTGVWTPMGGRGLAPGRRLEFSRVWDGNEVLIWGGGDPASQGFVTYGDGFFYDPATDSWTPFSNSGAPEARRLRTSVWTGQELIVWGGTDSFESSLADGGRFDPATSSWSLIPVSSNSPSARDRHSATWTGTEMVIWGGRDKTGARFRPSDGSWTPTAVTTTTARDRGGHTAVWDGTGLIVYGGELVESTTGASNARYLPATDSWLALAQPPMFSGNRRDHAAVWDGHRMLVWGGFGGYFSETLGDGLAYDPQTDAWTTLAAGPNAPTPRMKMQSAWDGESLIIWGGQNFPTTPNFADGSRYVSASDSWVPMTVAAGVSEGRADDVGVFSDSRFYVWGGLHSGYGVGQGATYCRCAGTTIYRDADGDGAGNPLLSQTSCVVPAGYVTASGDCNDADSSIYPGAPEICDSLDNNCDQVVDNVPAPNLVRGLYVSGGLISWDAVSTATHYDVVRGDVALLLSSAGDFALSQVSCVADNSPTTSITDLQSPATGAATYYLSRAQNCGGAGSYDEPSGGQSGTRDSEIAASAGACP